MLLSVSAIFAQETTGSIEITVKDSAGAVVPNVSLEVVNSANSSTTGYKRTVTTDAEGFQRIIQVPPGVYSITVAASNGFAAKTLDIFRSYLVKLRP